MLNAKADGMCSCHFAVND